MCYKRLFIEVMGIIVLGLNMRSLKGIKMAFRLAVQNKDDASRQSFFYDDAQVCIGDGGDLVLEGFAGKFEILAEGSAYFIKNIAGELRCHGEVLESSALSPLKSGAELMAGKFVFNFYISHKRVRMSHKNNAMGTLAKILMVLVVLVELFIVFLLPERAKSSELFVKSEFRGRSVLLLDVLRRSVSEGTTLYKASSPVIQGLIKLIKVNLDKTAWYLRENADYLNEAEIKQLHADLLSYEKLIARLGERRDLDKLPELSDKTLLEVVYRKLH